MLLCPTANTHSTRMEAELARELKTFRKQFKRDVSGTGEVGGAMRC